MSNGEERSVKWAALLLVAWVAGGCGASARADGDAVIAEHRRSAEAAVHSQLVNLPFEGLAIETVSGVTLYGLDGTVVAELPGATFERGGLRNDALDNADDSFSVRTTDGIVSIGVRQPMVNEPREPSPVSGCDLRREGRSFTIVSCPEEVPSFGSVENQTLELIQGSTRRSLATRQDDFVGWWQDVSISPDEQFISADWHTDCDSLNGFVIRVSDGRRWALPSPAMGWTRDSEVLYIADAGSCGDVARGVYAMRPGGAARLVAPLPEPNPNGDAYALEIWRRS